MKAARKLLNRRLYPLCPNKPCVAQDAAACALGGPGRRTSFGRGAGPAPATRSARM